ncbi:unnamed protein product [Meloidogyne enterolobii]|uniref:Uncharacterized protein n=1 Tax=Meloidogyne enterolobii TaxID=390850 RepID=A0ACB1B8R5_MELEN
MVSTIPTLRLFYRLFIIKRTATRLASLDTSIASSSSSPNKFNRYDTNLKLVEALNNENFDQIGSPLILGNKTQIKNTTRTSELEPMEKLIENWEWKEHIEENLNRIIAEKPMSKECKDLLNKENFC